MAQKAAAMPAGEATVTQYGWCEVCQAETQRRADFSCICCDGVRHTPKSKDTIN